uniref:Uncharacterized protein n=1 Tax=Magallana gigas TaxID=29159 RepID=K1PUS0_MAGGI
MPTHLAWTKRLACYTIEIYGTINKMLSETMSEKGNGDWPGAHPSARGSELTRTLEKIPRQLRNEGKS